MLALTQVRITGEEIHLELRPAG
ncbi:MAG: hypothetical protein JWM54_974, partial [Acidobacteriaceae bacterium]|nr:hypothetical protein [Acidobacteriaceae bacterium]